MIDQHLHEPPLAAAAADTHGHMIAQDRVQPGPEGTGGGGNLGALVPQDYKTAWDIIKTLRPSTFGIPL